MKVSKLPISHSIQLDLGNTKYAMITGRGETKTNISAFVFFTFVAEIFDKIVERFSKKYSHPVSIAKK